MNTINTQFDITKFSAAFIAGEKSDIAIAKSLVILMIDFGTNPDRNTRNIQGVIEAMRKLSPDSHRTAAITEWIKTIGGFNVTEKSVSINKKAGEKAGKWLEKCKRYPWYMVAKDMQTAKPWSNPQERMIREYATGLLMGAIEESALSTIFEPAMVTSILAAKKDEKLIANVTTRMEKLAKQAA